MNNNHMGRDKVIDSIVELILRLSDELEKIKDQVNPHDLWPLHPNRLISTPFEDAKPLFNEIYNLIICQNGDMLSDDVILSKLLYEVAAIRMEFDFSKEDIRERAQKNTEDLINYRCIRDVDIPLFSLYIDNDHFAFGPVTFFPILEKDKKTKWWERIEATLRGSVNYLCLSYARVSAKGTNHKSIVNAKNLVDESILLLRGIGFPMSILEDRQFGIINEYPHWKTLPYRLGSPRETVQIEYHSTDITSLGPSHMAYHIIDILNSTNKGNIEMLFSIISENGYTSSNEMQARILSGFRWLGEATKPDALAARFAKTAFSLEAFIGGEAKDENLMTRGITAALAERAAFLVGNSQETRYEVHKQITKYYGMRSGITHGRTNKIKDQDFERFGQLVREIGWSLVNKIDQFNSMDNLQEWIINQRYSMGDIE